MTAKTSARTPEDAKLIADLRSALDAGPTPGPWKWADNEGEHGLDAHIYISIPPTEVGGKQNCISILFNADWGKNEDARFIAACRDGVPALLNAYDADRALIASLTEALRLLVADVEDYEAWQRPCLALDRARAALSRVDRAEKEGA